MNFRMLGVTVAVAAVLTGATVVACSSHDDQQVVYYDYVSVCVDHRTGMRLPDSYCTSAHSGDNWYYYDPGRRAPAIGSRADGGTWNTPTAANGRTPTIETGGVPDSGGTITRNGFGPKTQTRSSQATPGRTTIQVPPTVNLTKRELPSRPPQRTQTR